MLEKKVHALTIVVGPITLAVKIMQMYETLIRKDSAHVILEIANELFAIKTGETENSVRLFMIAFTVSS